MRLFISLTGAQYAGKHLQQTAKEIKSGGLGALFGEVTKRVTGGSTGSDFGPVVHAKLSSEASQLDTLIGEFGRTVEKLLIKHKKGIIGCF